MSKHDYSRFIGKASDFILPACASCVHKHRNAATCTAFPTRIPEEMLNGTNKHTTAYPGDHGIRYLAMG
jgi:hypothetical protein